jgi:hypothetical protein
MYVVGHGTEIVELIGVRHRTKIARALGHLFVIAMQISENRNVFSIFLIPLFGCAFAVLFVRRQTNL